MSQDTTNDPETAFDAAVERVEQTNEKLAGGNVSEMAFQGAIGYHNYVATGETDIEYLYRTALLAAMDDTFMEELHTEAGGVEGAVADIREQLAPHFSTSTLNVLMDRFAENMHHLRNVQQERRGGE